MKSSLILLVDDEPSIVALARLYLEREGFTVQSVADGSAALESVNQLQPALVVLDVMLPELDGFEVCRRLRAAGSSVAILMLTAREEDIDKILGLELGADDYMTKPFSVRELLARVKALLRRAEPAAQPHAPATADIDIPGLSILTAKRLVVAHGRRVELTPKEYDLLLHLASHPGITFTRDELLNKVWGYEFSGYEHTVNSHINRLRGKIERDLARPKFILTTWGVGYRFIDP